MSFLSLPPEVRYLVYPHVLRIHLRVRDKVQPDNTHIRLLQTCKYIRAEAVAIFGPYVSLRHERQIRAFIRRIASDASFADQICWADVANDGRFIFDADTGQGSPASALHLALGRLRSLRTLRVFECRQGFAVGHDRLLRLSLQLERAMFPTPCLAPLIAYELHLDIDTRINMSGKVMATDGLRSLRISGTCSFDSVIYERLEHFAMVSVKGNYFDTHGFTMLRNAPLVSFAHVQANNLAYDMRDEHLFRLIAGDAGVGRTLRTLVLIGCTRLTTTGIGACVRALPVLEYLSLSLVMQDRPTDEFVYAFPQSLRVLKLRLVQAKRWSPSYAVERRVIWSAVEREVLMRTPPLDQMCIDDDLGMIQELSARWRSIASPVGPTLELKSWSEEI